MFINDLKFVRQHSLIKFEFLDLIDNKPVFFNPYSKNQKVKILMRYLNFEIPQIKKQIDPDMIETMSNFSEDSVKRKFVPPVTKIAPKKYF